MAVPRREILEEVAGYVDFTDRDATLLHEAGHLVRPNIPHIVDLFYAAIQANAGASAVITGGPAQIERLKATLRTWLDEALSGTYDEAYIAKRAQIGRVHVRVGLDQRYMFSAMNLLREGTHRAFDRALDEGGAGEAWPDDKRRDAHRAIDKICDIELALMLETYREDYATRIRNTERLASLGQFAASIGHELRNPLAVIETSLHLLRRRVAEDPKVGKHVQRIGEQVTLCGSIIADLLELARDRPPNREATDVGALVRGAIEGLPIHDGVRLELDVPSDLGPALLDGGQLRQVLVNLVMNGTQAVRGTGEKGRVAVRAWAKGKTLAIDVEDTGPGLSAEVLARLFEPLFTTRSKGIGLGLALCKRIVEKHGGTIAGKNRSGGGAIFEVRIPGALGEAS